MKKLQAFWLVLAVFLLGACAQPPAEVHLQGRTMGTTYNVKYVPGQVDVDPQMLKQAIDQRLLEINDLMSHYIPDSELSRFNKHSSTEPFAISDETRVVMEEAVSLGLVSEGALDVTIGPLINLWGFGENGMPEQIPTSAELEAVKLITGLNKISLTSGTMAKLAPEMTVNLSPIAKGYGVDQVAFVLEQAGLSNYLAEIGGEMRVAGVKANGDAWRIAVEKPVSTERAVQKVLSIGSNALATSGDYRNYFEKDGRRYSHLIDPRSQQPIQHNLVSVTVVHPSCMTADGLATAISVIGKERGLALAERMDLAVLLVTRENGEFVEYTSRRFDTDVTVL